MRGKIIVIEGLDGSGKTTQWEMLKSNFNDCLFLTFPDYDSESGKIVRRYLNGDFEISDKNTGNKSNSAYSASSFYAIDRYISYMTVWGEKYRNGGNVISARYTSSNAIYQMTKLPQNEWEGYLNWLYDYEHDKLGIPKPDFTVFLDVPVEISRELLKKRYSAVKTGSSGGVGETADIHEGDADYLNECRKAALYAAKLDNWNIIQCVNANGLRSPGDINAELAGIIGGLLV